MLLKKHIKKGGDSVADARKPTYDPNVFLKRVPNTKQLIIDPQPKDGRQANESPTANEFEQMLVSQRKIADGLGEMSRYSEHKKEQDASKKKRAASSYVAYARKTINEGTHAFRVTPQTLVADPRPTSLSNVLLNETIPFD